MSLSELDSRINFGTDIERLSAYPSGLCDDKFPETLSLYPRLETVRVILGRIGPFVRLSAPSLDLVVDGKTKEQVWVKFLNEVVKICPDSAWLTFDLGATRPEEIQQGLDIDEDEDWSGGIAYYED